MKNPMKIPQNNWRSRWLYFDEVLPENDMLHRVSEDFVFKDEEMIAGTGTTVCGQFSNMHMPGIFSRMGLRRCSECCKIMNIPDGKGAPFNNDLLEEGDNKIVQRLENFSDKLDSEEKLEVTEVTKEQTPDGTLHNFEKKTLD